MKYTWINGIVYKLLERIGDFQIFFSDIAEYLAAICLLMSIGMMCVKIFLQAADARQEIIKLFLNVIIYTVMIWVFPIAMNGMMGFATSLGYGAVMQGGKYISGNYSSSSQQSMVGNSDAAFYEWIAKKCGDIFSLDDTSTTNYTQMDNKGNTRNLSYVKTSFNMNIIDKNSGFIDLNKSFRFILAYMRLRWDATPKVSLFDGGAALLFFITYCISVALAFIVYVIIMINYIMCLFDYFAIKGFGILFVPLFLWEGTKQNTSTLIQSITKILVKMIVISAVMFLCFMTIVDNLKELFYESLNKDIIGGIGAQLTGCLSLIFQSVFLFMLSKETSSISEFLCGGSPRLSFGEFAKAAAGTAAATAGGVMGGLKANNAFGNAKEGLANTLASGAKGFASGGIAGGVAAFAKQGALNLGKGALSAVGSLPGIAKGLSKFVTEASGARGAMSMEGINMGFLPPGSKGDGGAGDSKGSGSFDDMSNGISSGGSPTGNKDVSDGSKVSADSAKGDKSGGSSSGGGSTGSSDGGTSGGGSTGGSDGGTSGGGSTGGSDGGTSGGGSTGGSDGGTSGGGSTGGSDGGTSGGGSTGGSDGGTSGGGSQQAMSNQEARSKGLRGIYGNVDGNKNDFANNMLQKANSNAESSSYNRRHLGRLQAAVANFARGYTQSREKGKGVLSSFSNGIVNTAKNSDFVTEMKSLKGAYDTFKGSRVSGLSIGDSMKNAAEEYVNNQSNAFVRAVNFGGGIRETDASGNSIQTRALGKESQSYDSNGNVDDNGTNKSAFESTQIYGKGIDSLNNDNKGNE